MTSVWMTFVALICCKVLFTVDASQRATSDVTLGAETESGLIMTFPKTLLTNTTEKLCFTMMGLTGQAHIWIGIDSPFSSCLAKSLQWSGDEKDVCLDLPIYCQSSIDNTIIAIPRGSANLHVLLQGTTLSGKYFSKRYDHSINFVAERKEIFIQTDKPMYQPGQKVQFRVLTVKYPDMKPYLGNTGSVWITSPGGTRLRQWNNPASTDGLLDLDFDLSSEPEMGKWKIHVDVTDVGLTTQTFDVEEYVLPKFEVTINTPSYIYMKETGDIIVRVCAKYTYGQPVRGNVQANITVTNPDNVHRRYGRYGRQRPILHRVMDADSSTGCAEFQVPASELYLDAREYSIYDQKLTVVANFTESGTDVSMNARSAKTFIATEPVTMTIMGADVFKPGLPYRGQVAVTLPDGAPAASHHVRVWVVIAGKEVTRTVTTEKNGRANFELPTPCDSSVTSMSLRARFVRSTREQYISLPDDTRRYIPRTVDKSIKAWFSPSGSFLDILSIDQMIKEGQDVPVQLRFTIPEIISEIAFYYRIVSRGRVISHGQHQWINQNVSNPLPVLPVEINVDPVSNQETVSQLLPQPSGSSRTRRSRFYPWLTTKIAPALPHYPCNGTGQLQFSFGAVAKMSPISRLVVYYIRNDREIVAASTQFKVAEAFENKVSVEFVEGREVRPGQPASIAINAVPNSLCAVSVVDKSVHIMGGNNQLTKGKVFSPISSLNEISGVTPTDCPNSDESSSGSYSETSSSRHADGAEGFRTTGLGVITDLDLETRPCWRRRITTCTGCRHWLHDADPGARRRKQGGRIADEVAAFGPMLIMHTVAFVDVMDVTLDDADTPPPSPPPSVVELRHYFPETWLWKLTRIGADGSHTSQQDIPHTITDWAASAFCLSAEQGVGIAEPTYIRAFQPFFLSYTLPYSVIRGEKVPIKVTVFNYLSQCIRIQISLTESTNFTIATRPEVDTLQLCGNMAETVQYEIIPIELGDIPIRVHASSDQVFQRGDGILNDVDAATTYEFPLTDAIEDTILVEPEGSEREETFSELICPNDNEDDLYWNTISLRLPSSVVPGSARGRIQVIGDVMGPVMSNLDSLLRMPTGCGEQNMIIMAPNIYVMQYLSHTNQLTSEIEDKALGFMRVGYQRELGYKLRDGSYSAFGESDGEGSTWLTAFVLKCFAQSQSFMDIDEDNLAQSRRWLYQTRRDENGCFIKSGRVIHKEMQGDVSGPATMTAFITIALLEAGASPFDSEVTQSLDCIKHWLENTEPEYIDTYTLAISSYAFGLGEYYATQSDVIFMLEDRAVIDGDKVYWSNADETEEEETVCHCFCRANSAGVEITAYALLGFLHQDEEFGDLLIQAMPIVRWLNGQRNSLGGFSSTQDTVVGLQALSYFAEFLYDPDSPFQLNISVNATRAPPNLYQDYDFEVNAGNRLVLQRDELAEVPTELSVTATGSGCVLFQAELHYNLPVVSTTNRPLFNITITVQDWEGNTVPDLGVCGDKSIEICIRYTGNAAETNMAVVEMKMVSGYVPHEASLEEFHSKQGEAIGLKRIDKYEKGKPLALYFDKFDDTTRCVPVNLKQQIFVKDAKDAFVKVYDYYKPGLVGYKRYHTCEVEEE